MILAKTQYDCDREIDVYHAISSYITSLVFNGLLNDQTRALLPTVGIVVLYIVKPEHLNLGLASTTFIILV